MDLIRKANIRKNDLLECFKHIPDVDKAQQLYLQAVFIREQDTWKYLIGKCSVSNGAESQSESRYRRFYFVSVIFEGSVIDFIEQLYTGYSICTEMPDLKFPENTNWEEELVPSHSTKARYPIRVYKSRISKVSTFNDCKLIGYETEFYFSAKEYIQDYLSLSEPLGQRNSREGNFILELKDKRGRITIENNRLFIEGEQKSFSLVGKINDETSIVLKDQETYDVEEIEKAELWLLNRHEDVIDYISSTEWPHTFTSSREGEEENTFDLLIKEGEGSTCEFKSYIRLNDKQNSKVDQIAKTVCAFSNSKGGYLFIGVNDNAEVEDITTHLRKDYGGEISSSLDGYISDLKKCLKENLTQDQCFTIGSARVFSKLIIIVNVTQTTEINSVQSERLAYIRKGATSMKMLPEEVQNRNNNSLF